MILLLAILPVLAFAILTASVLRPPSRISALVSLYVLSYANVVFAVELAATVRLLNPPTVLLLHSALAVGAWILWIRADRPPLPVPSLSNNVFPNRTHISNSLRTHPGLWALGLGVGVSSLIGAALVLTVPPNNYDSMTYHLSRVGYWLQHESFYPWPTPNPRQTTFPMNAEIGAMWTILFVGTDRLAGFVQWSAGLVSMVAIMGLSRLLGANRAQAVFAALLWATLPEIVLQSTTTQNDLVVGAFFTCAVYLLYVGLRSQHNRMLLLSGLGLGLALGTKATGLFLLPGLAATLLMLCLAHGKRCIRGALAWAGSSLAGFLLLGAYVFALNLFVHGHSLGPSSVVSDIAPSPQSWVTRLSATLPLSVYRTLDLTGLPDFVAEPLHQLKASAGARVFSFLDLPTDFTSAIGEPGASDLEWRPPVHEDFAGFGPLAFLLFIPTMIYRSLVALKAKDPLPPGLAMMSLSLFLAISILSLFPWENRLLVPAAALGAPLIGRCYRRENRRRLLTWAVIGMALVVIGWTTAHNLSKPLVGTRRVWQMDYIERRALNRSSMEPVLRAVDRLVPLDATLGTVLHGDDWDYPLFGRRFTRRVVPLFPPPERFDRVWLEERDIDFVIVSDRSGWEVPQVMENPSIVWSSGPWHILHGQGVDFSQWDPGLRNRLLEVDQASVLSLGQSLSQDVGVGEVTPPPWGEDSPGEFMWLGQGTEQGIEAVLWANRQCTVALAVDLTPGPGRSDALRRVDLSVRNKGGVGSQQRAFDTATTLRFVLHLEPGRNEVSLQCLDQPTVLVQPNGDSRPLLVKLGAIRVTYLFDQDKAGPADSPLVTVDPALRGIVGISPHLETPPWNVELDGQSSFLWLGQGDDEGIQAVLWSDRQVIVDLVFDVAPGPGRPQALRNVYLSLESDTGGQRQIKTLEASGTLTFAMELQKGRNDLTFGCLDEATVLEQPNGDTRPLLVLLQGVRIARSSLR
jgi:4-amino-4-deoxy-L-arabinose transferase-like glycosyltransferase